jgi:lipopolysaccharide export system permease protein
MGYGRRIVAVSAGAAAARIAGFSVEALCGHNPWLNLLQYLIPLAAAAWAFRSLFRQRISRPIAIRPLTGVTSPAGVRP